MQQGLKRQIVEKGVKQLLDEAKVPQRVHLQVLEALAKRTNEHNKDTKLFRETLLAHLKELGATKQQVQYFSQELTRHQQNHDAQIAAYHTELERSRAIKKGDPGNPGKDAQEIDIANIIAQLIPHLPPAEKGDPGKDAQFDEKVLLKKLIEKIQKDKSLDLSHIRGAQSFIKDGVKYKVEELMHGGGSSTSSSGRNNVTPTGVIPGSIFVLPFTPDSNLRVYLDGVRGILNKDYTVSGTTISTIFPVTTSIVCDD